MLLQHVWDLHFDPTTNIIDVYVGRVRRNASETIFADSISASMNTQAIGAMNLREVCRRDPETGHLIKEYFGGPLAWMSQFMGQRRTERFNFNRRD